MRERKTLKQREYRRIEKELGVRYRGWEQMPNESFTEFRRRLTAKKARKVMCVVSLTAVFFFQLPVLQLFLN